MGFRSMESGPPWSLLALGWPQPGMSAEPTGPPQSIRSHGWREPIHALDRCGIARGDGRQRGRKVAPHQPSWCLQPCRSCCASTLGCDPHHGGSSSSSAYFVWGGTDGASRRSAELDEPPSRGVAARMRCMKAKKTQAHRPACHAHGPHATRGDCPKARQSDNMAIPHDDGAWRSSASSSHKMVMAPAYCGDHPV